MMLMLTYVGLRRSVGIARFEDINLRSFPD